MRRSSIPIVLAIGCTLVAPPAVADPVGTCPAAASGFTLAPINDPDWTPSDPVPAAGQEPLWDRTVAGLLQLFPTVEDAASALGFVDVTELYTFALAGWLRWDRNGDAHICVRPYPPTSVIPPYAFNIIDNRVRLR